MLLRQRHSVVMQTKNMESVTNGVSLEVDTSPSPKQLITQGAYQLSIELLHVPLFVFSILGIVTNSINIRVFARQGVTSDSVTISLFALSVSDLLGCAFMLPQPVCFYLQHRTDSESTLIRNCLSFTTMSTTYPHMICNKITCLITVYLSVERALCVLAPLRVKTLIKTKNTAFVMVAVYVLMVIAHTPYATNTYLAWIPDASNNGTLKAVVLSTPLGRVFFILNNIFITIGLTTIAMFTVTISTAAMIMRLNALVKWRSGATNRGGGSRAVPDSAVDTKMRGQQKPLSARNLEISKTVTAITSVYLASLLCTHVPALATFAVPGMSMSDYNSNLFEIIYTLRFDFDVINSSVHFFFYVRMSSRYRRTFNGLVQRR